MSPLPVVVCGKNPAVAKVVAEGLLPEYEVIHVITNPEQGKDDLPTLLSGKAPTPSTVGTHDYSRPPVAIAVGGGYDEDSFNFMRSACKGSDLKAVPWLRPADVPKGPPADIQAYGKEASRLCKIMLDKLQVGQGEREEWRTETYYY